MGISKHYRQTFNMARAAFLSFSCNTRNRTCRRLYASKNSSPWTQEHNAAATQADACFENYRFREGEHLPGLRIHYATLGTPGRNDNCHHKNRVSRSVGPDDSRSASSARVLELKPTRPSVTLMALSRTAT